jgi:uncharacterized protein YegP (UPF0339 family)
MATGSQPDSVFYGFYDKYVGDAGTKPEVYGYWAVSIGLLAVLVAAVVFLVEETFALGLPAATVRQAVVAAGAVGVVVLLLGLVLQLPLRRRAVYVAVLGAAVSLLAVGQFVRIYPGAWELGGTGGSLLATAGYLGGLAVLVLVAALVPVATGRRPLLLPEESADAWAWVPRGAEAEDHEVSDVLLGEATRDGVFAVFPSNGGWRWRFVEQAAIADGAHRLESADAVAAELETVKEKVADAGLLEVNHAAFRIYKGVDEGVRWALVDDDGVRLGDSDGSYEDREAAESDVNLLKEHGPDAALLDVEEGAFEVYGDGDAWHWRLVDEERTEIGAGPDGYVERPAAETAVAGFRETVPDAPLMDVEQVGFELVADEGTWHWELVDAADTTIARSAAEFPSRDAVTDHVTRIAEGAIDMPFVTASAPGYEVLADEDGGWRWRLVDDEGAVVAESLDAVPSAESGRSVVDRLKDAMTDAEVLALEDAEFEIYPDGDEWAWRLVTEDRRTIAASPKNQGFESEAAAESALDDVRDAVGSAERTEFDSSAFHLYEAEQGAWNWRLVDADGTIVSDSNQKHASREDAAAAMSTMKEHAPDADLVEIESPVLECYEADDEWHWRLVDAKGETLATSPGTYDTAEAAHDTMDTLALLAPDADARVMDAGVFQVYATDEDPRQWAWRIVRSDGTVTATSASGYAARGEAWEAAQAVAAFAADATVHTFEDLAVRFVVEGAADEDGAERWHWEIIDTDRSVLAVGTERFPTRDAVAATARLVRDNAGAASVFEVDPAAFRLEETADGWRWRLVDPDRETVAVGSPCHDTRPGARGDLTLVRDLVDAADLLDFDLAAFEILETTRGWSWRFVDTAGTVLGKSGRDFDDRAAAEEALSSVRDLLSAASLLEIESPAFELHRDDADWRWRLVDTDGATIAEGKRTYPTRREAREALDGLRTFGDDAPTEVAD